MGEIAEMMLDGTLCEGCGVFLSDEPQGFPGYCSAECAHDRGANSAGVPAAPRKLSKAERQMKHIEHQARQKKASCPVCNRRVKQVGMADHMREMHPPACAEPSITSMAGSKEHMAFEAWASRQDPPYVLHVRPLDQQRGPFNIFSNQRTQHTWEGFVGALAAAGAA